MLWYDSISEWVIYSNPKWEVGRSSRRTWSDYKSSINFWWKKGWPIIYWGLRRHRRSHRLSTNRHCCLISQQSRNLIWDSSPRIIFCWTSDRFPAKFEPVAVAIPSLVRRVWFTGRVGEERRWCCSCLSRSWWDCPRGVGLRCRRKGILWWCSSLRELVRGSWARGYRMSCWLEEPMALFYQYCRWKLSHCESQVAGTWPANQSQSETHFCNIQWSYHGE